MRLAVHQRSGCPLSIRIYTETVSKLLTEFGIEVIPFEGSDEIPADVDLYWDPRSSGGAPPFSQLRKIDRPLVVTVHGAAPMAVAAKEYFPGPIKALRGRLSNLAKRFGWWRFAHRYDRIIAVSDFARDEIVECLGIERERISVIRHGVAHERFMPASAQANNGDRYFLHMSQYQPLKNVRRMLEAHSRTFPSTGVRLLIVAPGLPDMNLPEGATAIRHPVDWERAAELYRHAHAFLFPSLRESFGMPILEAMASGCPVITSQGSACEETAGGAALLVDPRSVEELSDAMLRLAQDSDLRADLIARGLAHAQHFSWRKSAQEHLAVFKSVLQKGPDP